MNEVESKLLELHNAPDNQDLFAQFVREIKCNYDYLRDFNKIWAAALSGGYRISFLSPERKVQWVAVSSLVIAAHIVLNRDTSEYAKIFNRLLSNSNYRYYTNQYLSGDYSTARELIRRVPWFREYYENALRRVKTTGVYCLREDCLLDDCPPCRSNLCDVLRHLDMEFNFDRDKYLASLREVCELKWGVKLEEFELFKHL